MHSALLTFMKTQRAAIVVGLVVTPFMIAALEGPSKIPQTLRLATTKQPSPFSELYFAEPSKLPKTLTPGQMAELSFVITNHEAAARKYRYQVLIIKSGTVVAQTEGEVTLRDGQSSRQLGTIPAAVAGEHLQVVVRLPEKNQEIRFRTEVSS